MKVQTLLDRTSDYLEIEKYVYKIKNQNWQAGFIDIFRLVHYYDLAFPKLQGVPQMNNVENSSNIMFYRLCCWYIDQKQKRMQLL